MQALKDAKVDMAFITESWLGDDTGKTTYTIKSYGFKISKADRGSRGGGIAVIYRNVSCSKFVVPQHICFTINSFEYHIIRIKSRTEKYCIVCVYRKQEISVAEFVEELDILLDFVVNSITDILIVLGDFNTHFDVMSTSAISVVNSLYGYGLQPTVFEPTHREGHTLDQIFCNSNDFLTAVQPTVSHDVVVSDHFAIHFTIPKMHSNIAHHVASDCIKMKPYRRLKQIDIEAFRETVISNAENWSMNLNCSHGFEEASLSFKSCLQLSLDQHAPLLYRKLDPNQTKLPSWFDEEYIQERRKRRSLERKYKTNKSDLNKHLLSVQRDYCVELAKTKQDAHCQQVIDQCQGNQRELFKAIPKLLDKVKEKVLPDDHGNPKQLADNFNSLYVDKAKKIRQDFSTPPTVEQHKLHVSTSSFTELHDFVPATVEEITNFLSDMTIKTSPEDPIPAPVLKLIIKDLIPHILTLVNLSLATGSVEGLKESVVIPILKKHNLDHEILNNFRPITNIEFIGKMIEKVVLSRLNQHMNANNMHTSEQFGYKKGHSTEHVILEIVDEVLIGFEKGTATLVILLDLSAAFDTVDQEKLMTILENEIHIKGTALAWFRSFLFGRKQKVLIGNTFSSVLMTLFGVPQGSVLGPVLFNIYIRNLPNYIQSFGFLTSSYADDTNARLKFSLEFQYYNIAQRIPDLLSKVTSWMTQHFLKLNPSKTELILFSPKGSQKINGVFLNDNSCLRFQSTVELLGVSLDESLTLESHVNGIVSSCYYHLRNVGKMKCHLTKADLLSLVHSVVSSKLDYCNVILFGINKDVMNRLQKVQNAAARLIYKLPKHSSVSQIIRELHWLRIDERIVYKILVIVFKHFCCISPDNLHKILQIDNAETRHLKLEHFTTRNGRRSFSYVAPRFWNKLPLALRTLTDIVVFKKQLKFNIFNNIGNIMGAVKMYIV